MATGCTLYALFIIITSFVGSLYSLYIIKNNDNTQQKRTFWIYIFTVLLITLLCYGKLISSMHFSVDSYNLVFDMSPFYQMQIGRFLSGGIILLAIKLGINQVLSQQIFMLIWVITLTITEVIISETLYSEWSNPSTKIKILIYCAVGITFYNVFMMDLMLFTEMAMVLFTSNLTLALSILLGITAGNDWKKWMGSFLLLLASLTSYQAYICIYEVFVLLGLFFKYREDLKRRYLMAAVSLIGGGAMAFIDILSLKVLVNKGVLADAGRGASFESAVLVRNIGYLIDYQGKFWMNADNIFQIMVFPVIAALLFVLFLNILIEQKSNELRLYLVLFLLGSYVLAFAAHVIEKHIVLSPRSNIGVWSVISLVVLLGLSEGKTVFARRAVMLILLILYSVNIVTMGDMIENEAQTNAVDHMEARQICTAITQYEKDTGNYVSKIAVQGDSHNTMFIPDSRYRNWELGKRIMSTDYSNYRLIGLFLGRDLKKVEMPELVYKSHFDGEDWDCLNTEEQVFCQGDTAYIMIY